MGDGPSYLKTSAPHYFNDDPSNEPTFSQILSLDSTFKLVELREVVHTSSTQFLFIRVRLKCTERAPNSSRGREKFQQ
jgi:hypothetical protein